MPKDVVLRYNVFFTIHILSACHIQFWRGDEMKRILSIFFAGLFVLALCLGRISAAEFVAPIEAKSVILMEANTKRVLYEQNADEALPPASVTKVMTMLLVMEAIDSGRISLQDTVSVSENAASMGGSQVFLKAGEVMSVEDLLKSVVVSSANDAAVALAEYISGSEEAFVAQMNRRAKELGMVNTVFENTNGLDDTTTNHKTSARDIALMSRELIVVHPRILEYSSIWMDTIRDGAFGLSNTNRLIRFYEGANGLKTGSTAKAKFCISATAKRGDTQLIAVIMAAPTRDNRNETAKKLFDFGFANYTYHTFPGSVPDALPVTQSLQTTCQIGYGPCAATIEKAELANVQREITLPESLSAPIAVGDVVGSVRYLLNGEVIAQADIVATESVAHVSYFAVLRSLLQSFFLQKM